MKTLVSLFLFGTCCFSPLVANAAAISPDLASSERLPGVDAVAGISQLTGVAISPLLGVSTVGLWRFWKTPEAQRHLLPWFCHPWAWGIGFALIGLCFAKDFFGTAAPPFIKKPLDMAELFESKASALIACSAFVPIVISEISKYTSHSNETTLRSLSNLSPLACLPLAAFSFDVRYVAIPIAVVAFLVVWLAGHAINVLIALCPFGFVDALLKLFKLFLLGSVVLSSMIDPYFGAAVSLLILAVAAWIAPWAFRLTYFGTRLGLDIILPGRARRGVQPAEPHAFLARRLSRIPARTHGRLGLTETGQIEFVYRPWLIFRPRRIAIPGGTVAISKGFLFPSLLHRMDDKQRMRILIIFLPRYRSYELSLAEHLKIADVQDSTLVKGFKAVRAWLADTINLGRSRYAELRAKQAV
jgi:hypothetical protein